MAGRVTGDEEDEELLEDDEGAEDPPPSKKPKKKMDVDQSFSNLLQRYKNDALQLAMVLFNESYQERAKRRKLQEELTSLREQLPQDSVVLSKEEGERYNALLTAGVDFQNLTRDLEELVSLRKKVQEQEYQVFVSQGAEYLGYNPKVLETLLKQANAELVLTEEVDESGQKVKVPYIKGEGSNTKLSEYAEEHWELFMSSLLANAETVPNTPSTTSRPSLISQVPVGSQRKSDAATDFLKRRYGNKE